MQPASETRTPPSAHGHVISRSKASTNPIEEKIAHIFEIYRNELAKAKDAYQRVVQKYPQSDEAALARDRLKALGR